jgi:hypothetical protein
MNRWTDLTDLQSSGKINRFAWHNVPFLNISSVDAIYKLDLSVNHSTLSKRCSFLFLYHEEKYLH